VVSGQAETETMKPGKSHRRKAARGGNPPAKMEIIGLRTLPEIKPGDDLPRLVAEAAAREGFPLRSGDVLVLAQKIVSKAEGRIVDMEGVEPTPLARLWARKVKADPRLVEVVLRESRRIVRMSERVLIAETRHGFVCANAGVDRSNVAGRNRLVCLPEDPDGSARRIAATLRRKLKVSVAVIISDTFGRPWRLGLTNVAIGAAGLRVLEDLRGTRDAYGHLLRATILAVGDELASAAGLAMGKSARVPAVILRGFRYRRGNGAARELIRPPEEDMFR
jgi:coenzyme F420-0:L-glutamate ligase/coenzyme F420-1:gamma-L-glutamate ligase